MKYTYVIYYIFVLLLSEWCCCCCCNRWRRVQLISRQGSAALVNSRAKNADRTEWITDVQGFREPPSKKITPSCSSVVEYMQAHTQVLYTFSCANNIIICRYIHCTSCVFAHRPRAVVLPALSLSRIINTAHRFTVSCFFHCFINGSCTISSLIFAGCEAALTRRSVA